MNTSIDYNLEELYDVVVVGGGPAGLTAALYLARAKYRVLVVEKEQFGGQITITHEVVNYPGLKKISGKELTETIQLQAESFGAEFLIAEVENLSVKDDVKVVQTSRGTYYCLGILIATGAHPRQVGFKGEEEYKGYGVAYCATCDGEFFTGKEVFVIGGGYAAAEESVFLTKFAKHVTILMRGSDFSCAASVAEQAKKNDKITIITDTIVEEVSGKHGLDYIRYKNSKTNEITEYVTKDGETFGVFVFAGYSPDTGLLKGIVELNEQGYVITDVGQKTSVDGVYAAGDVCIKPLRQVVTATGDGALAATELEKYVSAIQRKTGLYSKQPVAKNQKEVSIPNGTQGSSESNELFTDEMKQQLDGVFSKMERSILLKLFLDNRPISDELKNFISKLTELSDKLTMEIANTNELTNDMPCVRVFLEDGKEMGIGFHGVPGGHEFTSFILGLYNASGSGQTIDQQTYQDIKDIKELVDMKILVSLSCTMCPDLVIACQRIAVVNSNIRAEVYDLQHFDDLNKRYNVMSVPCLVINDEKVYFGKKNIHQILEIIKEIS